MAWEDSRFQRTVPIENHSSKAIRLKLQSSCNCLAPVPSALTIPPGGQRSIVVTLDLTARAAKQPIPLLRPFRASLQAVLQDKAGKELRLDHWELSGKVRKVLDVSQFEVQLGRHSERRQPIPCQRVRVTNVVPVRAITATGHPAEFRVEVKPVNGKPSEHEITVVPKGILPVGRYRFDVRVEAELDTGRKVRPREFAVVGEIAADIQASPPQVCLGAKKRGETCQEYVVLTSLTAAAVKVIGHRVRADGLTVERVSGLAENTQPTYRFSQQIERLGRETGAAIFVVEREDGTAAEVRVPVEYHGLDPA